MMDLKDTNNFNSIGGYIIKRINLVLSVPQISFPDVGSAENELEANKAWRAGPDFLSKRSLEKREVHGTGMKSSSHKRGCVQQLMPAFKTFITFRIRHVVFLSLDKNEKQNLEFSVSRVWLYLPRQRHLYSINIFISPNIQ
jgi:hypothetical protein